MDLQHRLPFFFFGGGDGESERRATDRATSDTGRPAGRNWAGIGTAAGYFLPPAKPAEAAAEQLRRLSTARGTAAAAFHPFPSFGWWYALLKVGLDATRFVRKTPKHVS